MAQLCPHCSVENPDDAAFCGSCGKALPGFAPAGPRVVTGDENAATAAGQQLQAAELDRQRRKAFGVLLAVAIIQAAGGLIMLALASQQLEVKAVAYVVVLGIAAIFLALSVWARSSPLPAFIVGLVVFCTIHLYDALQDPSAIIRGILMKIVVIVLLIKAIQAGIRHRELMRNRSLS